MNRLNALAIGTKLLSVWLFRHRIPLSVGWAVTKRCNGRCTYCGKWTDPNDDTPPDEALTLCNQIVDAGTRIISLTGGEPLLRDDIEGLIRRLKEGGVYIILATNGMLLPEKLDVVKHVDRLNISLDGPREVNDAFRGPGSFDHSVKAIKTARAAGIPVVLTTVLHAANIDHMESMFQLAADLGCRINIQPVIHNEESSAFDPETIPTPEQMHGAIQMLIEEKGRSGSRLIENSVLALRHLLEWPEGRTISCESRLISCRAEPDGHIHNCGRRKNSLPETDYRKQGFVNAFRALPIQHCKTCWCSSRYELNMLTSLNPLLIANMLRRF
ncbi:radical SAM protein [Thermodesulfobacteriota bacterium]